MFDAIDSAYLAGRDLDACCGPYERLGLQLWPDRPGRRTLAVGGTANRFSLHFLSETARDGAPARPRREALATGRSLFAVGLSVADLDAVLARLDSNGLQSTRAGDADGMAWLPLHDQAGTDLILVPAKMPKAAAVHAGPPCFLKRLDHLAMVAHDLELKTRFWQDILGIPVTGEVTTPALVVRQMRIGDATLELLGPASPDSPLWQRPQGLVSMASWEVEDVEAAVGLAKGHGFTVTDPAAGPLPGTRIATIQGTELAGVNMQLLEYV